MFHCQHCRESAVRARKVVHRSCIREEKDRQTTNCDAFQTFHHQVGKMTTQGNQIDTNCMTLTRYILKEQKKHPHATGELTMLVMAIQTAVKSISNAVRKAGIASL
uniref:Fructose-1-6-bisphosphatase class I N-terminal domain-containing protein n=1 Tax=Scylla olivacea TaxID=85551 RepID=A0A0P4WS03_SCYOL